MSASDRMFSMLAFLEVKVRRGYAWVGTESRAAARQPGGRSKEARMEKE